MCLESSLGKGLCEMHSPSLGQHYDEVRSKTIIDFRITGPSAATGRYEPLRLSQLAQQGSP